MLQQIFLCIQIHIYVRVALKRRSLTNVTWINNSKKFSNRFIQTKQHMDKVI